MPPQSTYLKGAQHCQINHPTFNSIAGSQYVIHGQREDLNLRLNPILDASHTRNRNTSPPDSECFPGTREEVIQAITAWADDTMGLEYLLGNWDGETSTASDDSMSSACSFQTCDEEIVSSDTGDPETPPHIYWLHGFAGCGKSAISLEVARIYARPGRLLASYFFFRGAGDRSTMVRFAVTLASQLVAAMPATAPYIDAAIKEEAGLLTSHVSLATQLDRLVLIPFQSAVDEGGLGETLGEGSFLIVIDGLDECEDQRGVEEFIDHILDFFEKHPTTPLRVFIASRVEQHIRERLEVDEVRLDNLDNHLSEKDIEKFLEVSFQKVAKRDRIVRAYVRERGAWPQASDMDKLVKHIGGSFLLASTIFKYIVQSPTKEDPLTPMERLPLTLKMNGLDGMYSQTLARSQHLLHFHNIISTIALLLEPLSIVEISTMLAISTFEVVRVLLNLQAIIHVPGTDEEGKVTICHTSLRDFLTTKSRSGSFFVPSSSHLYLSYYCFSTIIERNVQRGSYCWMSFDRHWDAFADSGNCDFITEIERFKARQPLLVNGVAYHTFLFSMFFYSAIRRKHRLRLDNQPYLLTQCANQLVLATESADLHTQRWLKKGLHYVPAHNIVQFTEDELKTLQHDLQRASTAIRANFPGVLESQPSSTREKKMVALEFVCELDTELQFYYVDDLGFQLDLSGIDIFNALQWMVARAHFKWEELRVVPHPPLDLTVLRTPSSTMTFSFDKELGEDDNDQAQSLPTQTR